MKRILTALVSLCLAASLCLSAFGASKGSFDYFQPVNTFSEESFADVSGWFAPYVSTVYSMGLMQGSINTYGERAFNPDGAITLAEIITLADRIRSTYYNDGEPFLQGSPWYRTYVDYAVENGILSSADEYGNYSVSATRVQCAGILARALPETAYTQINMVELGAIPDLDMEQKNSLGVYTLYRAGIFTGSAMGAFRPDDEITRSEVAAVAARIVDPSLRVSFSLYAPLYVGFTIPADNAGKVGITGLTMTTDGTSCYLTMDFKSQESRFLSIMNASESLYILKVVAIEQDVEHFTFAFPMETLQTIYEASKNPHSEKLIMEFYTSGDPTSVTDRFYITIDQFAKYFEDTDFS